MIENRIARSRKNNDTYMFTFIFADLPFILHVTFISY